MGAVWDYITGASQSESDAADAKLAALNAQRRDSGAWDQATYDNVEAARLSRNTTGMDVNAEVWDAAKQGAAEGFNTETGFIKDSLNTVGGGALRFFWQSLPWWVWLIGLFVIAGYLGLLGPLLGKARAKIIS